MTCEHAILHTAAQGAIVDTVDLPRSMSREGLDANTKDVLSGNDSAVQLRE
jgi:hypothetical protein